MSTEKSTQTRSLLQAIGKSFYDSIGDIVLGMEDGTVSIFGLVFGVAFAGFLIGKLVTHQAKDGLIVWVPIQHNFLQRYRSSPQWVTKSAGSFVRL